MGVRITSQENVSALFDSVSGVAFGPVFEDEFEAEEFLAWYAEQGRVDLRLLPGPEVERAVGDFHRTRLVAAAGGQGMAEDQSALEILGDH
jgi:hypothetical protein